MYLQHTARHTVSSAPETKATAPAKGGDSLDAEVTRFQALADVQDGAARVGGVEQAERQMARPAEQALSAPWLYNDDVLALWPPDQRATASCVAERESGWDPWEVGAAGERGLYQIAPVHAWRFAKYGGWDMAFDPRINTLVSIEIQQEQGWDGPWRAQRGWCW